MRRSGRPTIEKPFPDDEPGALLGADGEVAAEALAAILTRHRRGVCPSSVCAGLEEVDCPCVVAEVEGGAFARSGDSEDWASGNTPPEDGEVVTEVA